MAMKLTVFRIMALTLFSLVGSPINFLAAQNDSDPGAYHPNQNKFTLYYNGSWELTKSENAVYKRECYLDLIDMQFYGVYKDYTKENKLIGDGFYDQGVKRGLHSEYFENGSLKSTFEYANTGFIIWELTNDQKENEVTRGSGQFTISYYNFEEVDNAVKLHEGILKGEFRFGKRTGTWVYQNMDDKITDEEIYENGSFLKRRAFTKSGIVEFHEQKPILVSLTSLVVEAFNFDPKSYANLNQYFEQNLPEYPASLERSVTFPGGMKRLLLLSAVNLRFQIDDTMVAKLTVDAEGNVKKIKGPFILGDNYDAEFQRVLKPHEDKILPAVKNGKPYASTLRIPMMNSPAWINYLQTASSDDVNAYVQELNQN